MVVFKKYYKFLISSLFIWSAFLGVAQNKTIDTLQQKTLQELFDLYENTIDRDEKIKFINAFIKVAKNKKIKKRIVAGYYILSGLYDDERVLKYSDSIINLTANNSLKYYPSWAYISKAYYYQDKYQYDYAIDNYLLAIKFARKHKNNSLIVKINYSIGALKRKLQMYGEATALLKENLNYSKENNLPEHNLISTVELSNIYIESKKIDSAEVYIEQGKKLSLKLKDTLMYRHLKINSGIVEYHKGNYGLAIELLVKQVSYFKKKRLNNYLIYIHFYTGKSFDKIKNYKRMLSLYKSVDSLFQLDKPIFPFIREAYEVLISKYKKNEDFKKQLFYINRLMKFDSIINYNNGYVDRKIYKEYDIPKLKSEKETVIKQMKKNKDFYYFTIATFSLTLIIILTLFIYQNNRRRRYKRKFEEILLEKKNAFKIEKPTHQLNAPKEIELDILKRLLIFEQQQQFLNNAITLNGLAKKLKTNTSYLSRVINYHKNNSFPNYINELRINYTVEELKTNTTFQKFTIKAIAESVGFNNSESFDKAFYKLKGIKPFYFLREIQKMDTKN